MRLDGAAEGIAAFKLAKSINTKLRFHLCAEHRLHDAERKVAQLCCCGSDGPTVGRAVRLYGTKINKILAAVQGCSYRTVKAPRSEYTFVRMLEKPMRMR